MDKGQGQWSEAGRLFLLSLLLTPVTIVIHELGHFAVPLIFDLPAQLHPTRVGGGASPGSGNPAWMVAAQAGGGPLLTVVMGLVGGWLFSRDGRRLWALAFAAAAVSRLLVTTGYLAVRLLFAVQGRRFNGTPNFDEHNIARALGFSPVIASIVATGFLALLLFWLFRRVERGSRLLFAFTLTLAIGIGNVAWPAMAPSV
ncbi:hypothetical protein, partial [Allosphingosinicella sp.]|uniref:hypothetical protein n=1 Tax=Allosphingosinicella sp. TaxID=2823234 RepID=UPI002F11D146